MTDISLTREDVVQTYRLMLGREPESETIIQAHIDHTRTRDALIASLLASDEYRSKTLGAALEAASVAILYGAPLPVEHQVPDDVLKEMLERVRHQWTRLGESDPHWSVLSTPEFRRERMNADRVRELRASGQREAGLIERFESRTGQKLSSGVCVELGCGVGRITRYLADRFEKVIALDISPGNLQLCADYMAEEGITNVETRLISSFDDFRNVPEYDVLFSVIVLQHNPPPVQRFILQSLFSKMRSGGGAVFQIPTFIPGYSFIAQDYLSQPDLEIEMHALPTAVVLEELRDNHLSVLDFAPDPFTGLLGSHTFFATRT